MADSGDDRSAPTGTPATDALKDAGQNLLGLLVQRAAEAASQSVTGLADRLTDVTESGGDVRSAFNAGSRDGRSGAGSDNGRGGLAGAVGSMREKVASAFGGGGGGGGSGKKLKMTNIVESLDIGLPLRTTYNLWTQFEDFPSFMKKVETVEQEADEKTNWTAKVFVSRRRWEATIVEQVADSHIIWRSTGEKGHVDGAVTFTEVGPNLTRVLLVMEYWPKGLFEQTGNLWRAQGRRARLEFKHFRRHAMTSVMLRQEEVEGWRGEIRDSEVVKTHEDAVAEEQQEEERSGSAPEVTGREEAGPEGTEPEETGAEETGPDEYAEDEGDAEDETYAEDEGGDETAELDESEAYDEDEDYEEGEEGEEGDDEAYDEEEPYEAEGEDSDQEDEYADEAEDEAGAGEPVPARSGRRR
jgi:hypothetical protein